MPTLTTNPMPTIVTNTLLNPVNGSLKSKTLPPLDFDLDFIIDRAPTLIRSISQSFNTDPEKLVALFSSIVQSTICFPNAWVNYRNQRNYLHTYLLIVGPAGNGKGALSQVSKVISKVVRRNLEDNNKLLNDYQMLMDQYKKSLKSGTLQIKPTSPKTPIVSIPGNISSAKFVEILENNVKVLAVMIETELDSFGMASKTEHGSLNSTYLRQCFHSEIISVARKGESLHIFVEEPKIALTLSGTPSQLRSVFRDNEDGLYSRFLVNFLEENIEWDDIRPCENCVSLDDQFAILSDRFSVMYDKMKDRDVEIKLTNKQWDAVNNFGSKYLNESYHFVSEHAASIPKRHGLMLVRIAGVITMHRMYENDLSSNQITCTDEDFYLALKMIELSIQHSLALFQKLPGYKKSTTTSQKKDFINSLPENFSTLEALASATVYNISERTCHRWLSQFVKSGVFEKTSHGGYLKTAMALSAVGDSEKD